MPSFEAPSMELGSVPQTPSGFVSPVSASEESSLSSVDPPNIRPTPLFRALAMPLPDPEQPAGQDELERRLPGYRRIVIPRELTLIELLKESSGVTTDEEVLQIREAKLRVVADRVGLRRLDVLAPRLRSLTLDGSALSSLRDLGIGLVHLRKLSINRCGLFSLDGVWGLGALRELSAADNKLQDLQPLAALQKLHTLNLAGNPISEPSRLWTLGVCGSLRRLTLTDTPAANEMNYRVRVASALPMLVYLDDRPMHNDIDYDSDGLFGVASDSEGESEEISLPLIEDPPPNEPGTRPSSSQAQEFGSYALRSHRQLNSTRGGEASGDPPDPHAPPSTVRRSRRPATTEGAGIRPVRPDLARRPHTAVERPNIDAPTRLQILNTLMDEEWRCSGSKLTSHHHVCGNLARALRRPLSAQQRTRESERESLQDIVEDATRTVADEIPRVPVIDDWIKFKQDTGIDIDIDFTKQREEFDSSKAIDRLEQIEKETRERFKDGVENPEPGPSVAPLNFNTIMSNFEVWRANITPREIGDVDTLFNDLSLIERNMDRLSDSESQSEYE